ncbi:MAG: hypothetical protein LBJ47_06115, partial [Tannerella sp.]|nr:hypothetical protein [Tannerella sp.]
MKSNMMDTQETNLPEEERTSMEGTGKSEEPRTPENCPVETITETGAVVEEPEVQAADAESEAEETEVRVEEA